MDSTKSFCNVQAFASNEPGVTSPIGEITLYAATFSKELGYYRHNTIEGYGLLNFNSTSNDVKVPMSQALVDQAVDLVHEAVRITQGTSGEIYHDELLIQLRAKAETVNANTVEIGTMVNSGVFWVPEWISWSNAGNSEVNVNKVWLALDAFVTQYTDYEITVVTPFDDLDFFFNPGSLVEARVKDITPTQMIERAEVAKEGHPETYIRTDPYEYRDPASSARRFDVYWTVLIYGAAGNDPDIIRDSLANYILANSTHGREDWALIFPDIFKRTEFIFAPFWENYAAEQRVFDHGVYSPIFDQNTLVPWLVEQAIGYTEDQIKTVSQVMGFPYRSMQIATVGHYENRDGLMRITDYYPDFINVGTESTDFGRMSIPTQIWANLMMELVIAAEKLDVSTDLPRGMYRIVRGGKEYVGRTHNRVLLLVLSKATA